MCWVGEVRRAADFRSIGAKSNVVRLLSVQTRRTWSPRDESGRVKEVRAREALGMGVRRGDAAGEAAARPNWPEWCNKINAILSRMFLVAHFLQKRNGARKGTCV